MSLMTNNTSFGKALGFLERIAIALESIAASAENAATPVYHVNVHTDKEDTVKEIINRISREGITGREHRV